MKPYINIRLYPQIQTIATNIDYYDEEGELVKEDNTRYIVEHMWEIVAPIVEEYAETHNIRLTIAGELVSLMDLEQSYFDNLTE